MQEAINEAQQIQFIGGDEGAEELLQFLSFTVDDGQYAVDIMRVREIRCWTDTTRIPNAPEHMRGVINLRGLVIPIFDLRARFGLGLTNANAKNVVIVLAIGERIIGILVDAVSDILKVAPDDVKVAPNTGDGPIDDAYISGLVPIEDKMVVVLDVDYLFDTSVLEQAEISAES